MLEKDSKNIFDERKNRLLAIPYIMNYFEVK